MSRVLGIVYRAIETHLIQQAGCTRHTAKTGAVTLIQRFGSALNLNIHFHMLFLDGVYVIVSGQATAFFHLSLTSVGIGLRRMSWRVLVD